MNAHTHIEPAPEQTPRQPPETADGRAALVDVLRRRGEGATDQPTPNLPALLVTLAEEGVEAPQIEFTTPKKIRFLEALAVVGSVRDAARRVGVSHMTAYRARRKCAAFRRCWDAALVCALPHAEEELTTRAIDGVEEDVLYHGEVVATRRRKDPRLLLAHLGRLDRLAAREDVAALSERFDDALEALARGEDLPQPAAAAAAAASAREPAANSPHEPCNTRNTAPARPPAPETEPCDQCGGQCDDPDAELTKADCQWLGNRLDRMEAARPRDAPALSDFTTAFRDEQDVEGLQLEAFEAGVPDWWLLPGDDEEEREEEWLRLPEDSAETPA